MRHFSILFLFVSIISYAPQIFAEDLGSDAIHKLEGKVYRMDTKNGKKTMRPILNYEKSVEKKRCDKERENDYTKPCSITTASLEDVKGATAIKGGNLVIAFLDLHDGPQGAEGGASKSVITLFDIRDTNVPLCFKQIDLMDQPSAYYYGHIKAVDARELPNGNFFVVALFAGGDGGDSWKSHAVLHIDTQCRPTVLAKFYDYSELDDKGEVFESDKLNYKFESNFAIKIERYKERIINNVTTTKKVSSKQLDLNALLRNPNLRTIEP
jgi:hypothetical protein